MNWRKVNLLLIKRLQVYDEKLWIEKFVAEGLERVVNPENPEEDDDIDDEKDQVTYMDYEGEAKKVVESVKDI